MTAANPGLAFWHPAALVATVGGIGLLPLAPGTLASLAALPAAWLLHLAGGQAALLAGIAATLIVGWWAADVYGSALGVDDPPSVVIDEVMAQWLTLAAVPADPLLYAFGFVLFRIFDIVKPWPASWADRRLKGGFGIMADDFLAGVYAGIALTLVALLLERT